MKFKVLAYTFSVPLLWATLLLLQLVLPDFGLSRSFSTAVLFGLLIGSLIGRFFIDSKYLTDLVVDDEKISIIYLTPFARQRHLIIRHSTLTDIKLKKKIFLVRDFGSIKFFSKDNQIKFYFLNSNTKQSSEQLAQAYSSKPIVNNT